MPMHQREGQYRIQWKSLLTDYTSHGGWFGTKDKKLLETWIKESNKKYKGELHHWLVEGV